MRYSIDFNRYTPLKCDYDQYALLLMCSEEKDFKLWFNEIHAFGRKSIFLENADLRRVDLSNANLSGAYLNEAKMYGAKLNGASLHVAELNRA